MHSGDAPSRDDGRCVRKDRPSAATSHPRTQNTGSLWHPNTTCGPRFRHGFFIVFLQTPYINRARHWLASGGRGIRRNGRQAVFLGGIRGATTRLEPARFWPTARVDTPFLACFIDYVGVSRHWCGQIGPKRAVSASFLDLENRRGFCSGPRSCAPPCAPGEAERGFTSVLMVVMTFRGETAPQQQLQRRDAAGARAPRRRPRRPLQLRDHATPADAEHSF